MEIPWAPTAQYPTSMLDAADTWTTVGFSASLHKQLVVAAVVGCHEIFGTVASVF